MKFNQVVAERANKTVYRDKDRIIKRFDQNYSKADVLNEALNQARVEETELNIPKLLEVVKIDNCWAIVLEYIEGSTLETLMKECPEKTEEYLRFFVDLQLKMHAQRAPLLNKLHDKMNRKISQSPLNATTRYDLHTRLEAMPRQNTVCHGDYNPGNILIDKNGEPYIIDWSHATQGNPAADAARTFLLFWLANEPENAEKYLNLFCEKSDTARQVIQKWIPIVAASQLVKSKKEEKDFLLHWIEVVDYQ
ncbi:MAG: phosphotransferase [Clostridia bacterium]|nr:phosphotransferase [Clostridia bacterium]